MYCSYNTQTSPVTDEPRCFSAASVHAVKHSTPPPHPHPYHTALKAALNRIMICLDCYR